MKKSQIHKVFIFVGFVFCGHASVYTACQNQKLQVSDEVLCKQNRIGCGTKKLFGGLIKDAFKLHRNIIAWDSFKTVVGVFPFYIVARMSDGRLHSSFYDKECHKNVSQFHSSCREFSQYGIVFPVFFAASASLAARDEELKKTSRVFLTGLPFLMLASNLIKKFEFSEVCLRPWNEHFSSKKRSYGGFPSGHMAQIAYATTLYGMRFGVRYAVPLSALGVFVAGSFLNCNRHYASQLLAGTGLGVVYALAADKLITSKLSENVEVKLDCSSKGKAGIKVAFRF